MDSNSKKSSYMEKPLKKQRDLIDRVISFVSTSFDLIRSILIRIVFSMHIIIAVGMVSFIKNELWYLVNLVGIVFIVIEWAFFALKNGGKDQPWYNKNKRLF